MPKREKLPDDLKELCSLCRAGKLFAVQAWICEGKRYRLPPGNFTTSPLRTAISSGFHSLVEVMLQADAATSDEKSHALYQAVDNRNLDLIELLVKYGADPAVVYTDSVFWSRHPAIIHWFIAHGMNLESGHPIAKAFVNKQREFLGIYMDLRDSIPTARHQATMALRHHVTDGNLKQCVWFVGDQTQLAEIREGKLSNDFPIFHRGGFSRFYVRTACNSGL